MKRLDTGKFRAVVDGMASGAAWSAIGAIFSRGALMLYAVIIARCLGKEAAGYFSIVQSTGLLVLSLTAPGLHTAATKELARRNETDTANGAIVSSIVRAAWLMGLLGGGALFVSGDLIVTKILNVPALAVATSVGGGLIVLFGTLAGVCGGALVGLHRFRPIAMANFASGAVGLVVVSLGAVAGGVTGAVIGLAVTYTVNYILLRRALPANAARSEVERDMRNAAQLIRASLPLVVSYSIYGLSNWLAVCILGRSAHSYGAVASFAVGNQWQTAILFLPSALSLALLPRLTGLLSLGDATRFRHTFAVTLAANLGLASVGVVLVTVCARLVLRLYGPEFAGGEPILYAMALGSIPVVLANLTSQVVYAKAMMRAAVSTQVAYGVVLVALAAWLVPSFGALGLALATVGGHCALAVGNALAIVAARRSLK